MTNVLDSGSQGFVQVLTVEGVGSGLFSAPNHAIYIRTLLQEIQGMRQDIKTLHWELELLKKKQGDISAALSDNND